MTKEQLIEKVREVAARLGGTTMMYKDFHRESGVAKYWIIKHFDRWPDLCAAAGIQARRMYDLSDEEIFLAMREAFLKLGGIGTLQQMARHFRYHSDVVYSRLGGWPAALRALRDWLLVHDPAFPYLEQLDQYVETGRARMRGGWRAQRARAAANAKLAAALILEGPREAPAESPPEPTAERRGLSEARDEALSETAPETTPETAPESRLATADAAAGVDAPSPVSQVRPLVGEVIAYRGIMFAPTNEMGVVMLFGAMAQALGFVVESVGTAFPDCRAWRQVACGRFKDLRVELEFASSNFRAHRHPPKGCDLLVCWEHDWPKCPVPVLDLKKEIEKLRKG